MKPQPLVSIIIPTYNRAHLIGETLDSVLAQTYTNWECIVVDDGSTDETPVLLANYCKKDARFQYHDRPVERPKGANACRNYGFELSKGEYIQWLDSDDFMVKDKLECHLKAFKNAGCFMTVSKSVFFENNIKNINKHSIKEICSKDNFNNFIQNKIKILTPSALISIQFLIENKIVFNVDLFRSQEFEYYTRILSINDKYTCVDKVLSLIRKHEDSISYSKNVEDKNFSVYISRINLIRNYKHKLNKQSIWYILKKIIPVYLYFLNNNNFITANSIRKDINKYHSVFGVLTLLKFNLAFLSFLVFKKGEKILKF